MASIVLLLTQILHPTNPEFPSSSSMILPPSSSSSSSHYTQQQKSPRLDSFKISPLHEDPQDSRVMIDLF
ncbi:unnamed protein product [Arabidopsis lyrata]|uniref:Expressed protein n=1 Tax=Arabidopsis lyrata subsp. lyrata TaxID=81972 RepID=D7KB77_ARALL|nr:expressed protein [Arabidopsis lyrata subsp. lyrata]CAH8250907.1 unnamed protein product [Arabidopsis lyrata]